MRRWRALLSLAALTALGAAVCAAWLEAASVAEAVWLKAALAPFCHQQSQRSLELAGQTWGLCARCSGWWTGVLAASASSFSIGGKRSVIAVLIAALALVLGEVLTDLAALRFAVGTLLGAAVAGCVSITVNDRNRAAERWLSGRKQRFAKPS